MTVKSGMESLTLLHESQSHWKGRVAGSYSTSSRSSIVRDVEKIGNEWNEEEASLKDEDGYK